jgi:hypothetical protein
MIVLLRFLIVSLFALFLFFPEAQAEEAVKAPLLTQKTAADSPADIKALALAKTMHQLLPIRVQLDAAIESVVNTLPENDRDGFRQAVRRMIDVPKLEETSIHAMASTFTVPELEAMVGYYSKPEARSIAGKMNTFAAQVQPEITRMLDKAMLDFRTGENAPTKKPALSAPENQKP